MAKSPVVDQKFQISDFKFQRYRTLPRSPVPRFTASLWKTAVSFLFCAVFLIGTSCTKQPQPYRHSQFMMGTIVDAVVYPDSGPSQEAVNTAFKVMTGIEQQAWARRDGSPLFRLKAGEEVRFTGHLLKIMETAAEVYMVSGGAFEPALGELVRLWDLGGEDQGIPAPGDIEDALVRLQEKGKRKKGKEPCCPEPGTWLDLGGVGKGYAVDEAVRLLQANGVAAGIINAGGDLRAWGEKPGGKPWRVGVQDPDDAQSLLGVLDIGEMAVATSGDYQRYFEEGGKRYHHILDPDTGYPAVSGVRSVTVLAPDCALADALATAAFVLGPEEGLFLLEGWQGVEGVMVDEEGELLVTSGIGKVIPFEKR
jgi:thiamine biosynthesis lipoprotein